MRGTKVSEFSFTKNPKLIFFIIFLGGGAGAGREGTRVSDFFLPIIHI